MIWVRAMNSKTHLAPYIRDWYCVDWYLLPGLACTVSADGSASSKTAWHLCRDHEQQVFESRSASADGDEPIVISPRTLKKVRSLISPSGSSLSILPKPRPRLQVLCFLLQQSIWAVTKLRGLHPDKVLGKSLSCLLPVAITGKHIRVAGEKCAENAERARCGPAGKMTIAEATTYLSACVTDTIVHPETADFYKSVLLSFSQLLSGEKCRNDADTSSGTAALVVDDGKKKSGIELSPDMTAGTDEPSPKRARLVLGLPGDRSGISKETSAVFTLDIGRRFGELDGTSACMNCCADSELPRGGRTTAPSCVSDAIGRFRERIMACSSDKEFPRIVGVVRPCDVDSTRSHLHGTKVHVDCVVLGVGIERRGKPSSGADGVRTLARLLCAGDDDEYPGAGDGYLPDVKNEEGEIVREMGAVFPLPRACAFGAQFFFMPWARSRTDRMCIPGDCTLSVVILTQMGRDYTVGYGLLRPLPPSSLSGLSGPERSSLSNFAELAMFSLASQRAATSAYPHGIFLSFVSK